MILVILGLGLVLRLMSLNQSLWLDEGINIMAVKSNSLLGMVTQYAVADFHPPGWFVILWSWGKMFGYSEFSVRLPSVFFGVFTIYIVYLIGRKILSEKLGLLAALLLSINPLHIYYSQEARMYALAALAVALNIFLLVKVIKGEKVNLLFLVLSNLAILMSDYIAYFIFPAELIIILFIRKITSPTPLKKCGVVMTWVSALFIAGILSIWWLPIFLKQLNVGAVASANLPTWKFVAGSFDFKNIPLTFVKFIIGKISLADKTLYAALLLPVGSLFGFLLWRGQDKLGDFQKKLLVAWILIPVFLATVISVVIPVYNYFRVLYIVPAFVTLIAGGILSFKGKLKYIFFAAIVSIEMFCALVYLLNPSYQREDWKGLVKFLNDVNPQIVLFESSGTLPPFDYYAEKSLNAEGALKDFPAKDETAVAGLDDLISGVHNLYLVDYLVEISDPNRLVAKRLVELGYGLSETKDFHGVGFVHKYVKNTGI